MTHMADPIEKTLKAEDIIDLLKDIKKEIKSVADRVKTLEDVDKTEGERELGLVKSPYVNPLGTTRDAFIKAEYGDLNSTPGFRHIVDKILGTDFGLYSKHHDFNALTKLTLHVPERLSEGGRKDDFRSKPCADHMTLPELKTHCENVKSSILRTYVSREKTQPEFNIRNSNKI